MRRKENEETAFFGGGRAACKDFPWPAIWRLALDRGVLDTAPWTCSPSSGAGSTPYPLPLAPCAETGPHGPLPHLDLPLILWQWVPLEETEVLFLARHSTPGSLAALGRLCPSSSESQGEHYSLPYP